jgi:hypothetical protein
MEHLDRPVAAEMIVCRGEIAEKTPRSIGALNLWKKSLLLQSQSLIPKAKPIAPPSKINFDDAMRRSMRVPPPPSGKKAKRRVWRKKQRKSN